MRFHTTQDIEEVRGLSRRSMERPEDLGNKLKVFPIKEEMYHKDQKEKA